MPGLGKLSIMRAPHIGTICVQCQRAHKARTGLNAGHLNMTLTKPRALNDRYLAYRVVGAQMAVAVLIPLLVWIASGKNAAIAALTGGGIAVLGNLYFAVQAFRFSGARASREMVQAFYRGEAGKFVIVMLLFAAAFHGLDGIRDTALYLFIAFILVYGIAWLAPLILKQVK